MGMKSRWMLAVVVALGGTVLNSCINSKGTGTSGTGFLWVATQGDRMVTSFTINLHTGGVSQGKSAASGAGPSAMAITPDGKTLFLANSGDNTIGSYAVGSDGTLTSGSTTPTTSPCLLPPPPCPQLPGNPPPPPPPAPTCGETPTGMAVDPSGKFLFVANQGTFDLCNPSGSARGTISIFSISSAGLTLVSSNETGLSTDLTGTGPVAVAVPSSEGFVYVAHQFNSMVTGFAYDSNALLTQLPGSPYPVGANPSGLAFSRSVAVNPTARDNFLFVANSGSNNISIFNACVATSLTCANTTGSKPNGLLMPVGSAVGAGIGPNSFVVDPVADFVYAVDEKSNQVSEYKYSPATGALTALSPPAASTGSNPISAGVTHDGNWVFVANNGGSNLSAFQIGGAGKLNLPANPSIALSNQPSVVLVK